MKIFDVTLQFTQWDGETPIAEDGKPYRLADALVSLGNHCHFMGLSNLEKTSIFRIARAAARPGASEIRIDQVDYDALKKAVDANHAKMPGGEGDFFAPLVHGQLKPLIDTAPSEQPSPST
jgi:hypothetical protein